VREGLLELNHQRYAEEVRAGPHEKKAGKKGGKPGKAKKGAAKGKKDTRQMTMY
jgi:hypothetical protein